MMFQVSSQSSKDSFIRQTKYWTLSRHSQKLISDSLDIIKSEIMIKSVCRFIGPLIIGLFLWAVYDRQQWTEDFSIYEAPFLDFGPIDSSYEDSMNVSLFSSAKIVHDSTLKYPEDIAVSNDGTIYTGLADGRLVSISPSGEKTQMYHNNDTGMIIGIILTKDEQKLYYVTEFRGLVEFDLGSKQSKYLLEQIEGNKIQALNSLCLDEARKIIYMTVSSSFPLRFAGKDLVLKRQSGRIISYDLQLQKGAVVLDNLAYPNGIVFDEATQEIVFSELTHHSISSYSVNESNPSKKEIINNLFGYPDNLKLNEKGDLYVGIPAVRDPSIEYLNQNPSIRKQFLYVPDQILEMMTKDIAGGIKIDLKSGKITQYIFGSPQTISFVTTILEKNNKLYFSSLKNPTIVILDKNTEPRPESDQL